MELTEALEVIEKELYWHDHKEEHSSISSPCIAENESLECCLDDTEWVNSEGEAYAQEVPNPFRVALDVVLRKIKLTDEFNDPKPRLYCTCKIRIVDIDEPPGRIAIFDASGGCPVHVAVMDTAVGTDEVITMEGDPEAITDVFGGSKND